ncbi:hypothetical protein KA005_14425, partial [bacterium]|nr:hypothetical protein [bacterium]
MSSLAHCIDISGISKVEGDKLKAAAKAYHAEGYSAKDANTGAVQDAISAINGEKNDIVEQIKKQLPEYFKVPEVKEPIAKVEKEKIEVTPEKKLPWEGKQGWEMTKSEIKEKYAFTGEVYDHEGAVKQAIKKGKTIPPEVLKDYPDLKIDEKVEVEPTEQLGKVWIKNIQ